MSRGGQDPRARLRLFYQTLPPLQRGVHICVLLGNALLVVTLDGVVAVSIMRGAVHSWRHRRLGLVAATRTGIGPALAGAAGAAAIQWVVAQGLIRAVESGSAATLLEHSERWLTADAEGHNEYQ